MKKVHEDKRYNKKSLQAINVANEIIDRVQKGKRINLTEIQVSKGYSLKSAKSQKALQTKSFKRVIVPVLDRMLEIRDKALSAINKKELDKERLDSLVNLSKQMTHDTQLLSGKSTENMATNIVVYGEGDFLAEQVTK